MSSSRLSQNDEILRSFGRVERPLKNRAKLALPQDSVRTIFPGRWTHTSLSLKFALVAVLLLSAGCKEQIVHNLTENEANRLLTALATAPIGSEKVKQSDGRWALAVAADDEVRAIKYLDERHLLESGSDRAPEKPRLVSSREEQRLVTERALSHEIERTLKTFPTVLEARVHLNLPVIDPIFGQRVDDREGSGSVLLLSRDGQTRKEEVAAIVAGASGIKPERVTVVINELEADAAEPIVIPSVVLQDEEPGEPARLHALDSKLSPKLILPAAAALVAVGIALLAFLYPTRWLKKRGAFADDSKIFHWN